MNVGTVGGNPSFRHTTLIHAVETEFIIHGFVRKDRTDGDIVVRKDESAILVDGDAAIVVGSPAFEGAEVGRSGGESYQCAWFSGCDRSRGCTTLAWGNNTDVRELDRFKLAGAEQEFVPERVAMELNPVVAVGRNGEDEFFGG